jgi:hypothetical protein
MMTIAQQKLPGCPAPREVALANRVNHEVDVREGMRLSPVAAAAEPGCARGYFFGTPFAAG